MTVRETLNGCRTAVIEIAAIENQISWALAYGGPSSRGAWPEAAKIPGEDQYAFVGRGTNDPNAARQQRADGLMEMLRGRKEALEQMLIVFEALLGKLDDGTARTILRYYYGVAWTDDRIADELELSRNGVCKRRNAAVEYLENTGAEHVYTQMHKTAHA